MAIFITGATGMIGSALKEELLKSHSDIYCLSRNGQTPDKRVKWIHFDLRNPDLSGIDLPNCSVVYHLAAQTSTYSAQHDPIDDLQVNVVGFLNLLMLLKKQATPPIVILAGTTTEVGLVNDALVVETLRDDPVTFYDISKLTAEMYLKQCVREGWISGCSLRLANVYGASSENQQKDRGIIDKVFQKALSGENIQIYGDGAFLRDYVHLHDVVHALIAAAGHIDMTNGRHFNIASGRSVSLTSAFSLVIDIAAEVSGKRVNLEYVQPPASLSPIDFRSVTYDIRSFAAATGWHAKFDLESGIRYSRLHPEGNGN